VACEEEERYIGFGCGGEWLRRCSFYRMNGGKGDGRRGGSTLVVVGCFKLFGYGRGRVEWMNALVLIVAYDL
jgi:hypothetical protein